MAKGDLVYTVFKGEPRRMPPSFQAKVAMLRRPYTRITATEYDALILATAQVRPMTDFIVFNGLLCTFGEADGGYAIMPLAPEYQYRLEAQNDEADCA